MNTGPAATPFVDRRQVARRFARAAANYPAGDFLAREIDRRMAERLDYVRLTPQRILDLGCSRGGSFAALQARYPAARLHALDLVAPMLQGMAQEPAGWRRWLGRTAPGPVPVQADAQMLPFREASFDLIWSNLLLHWLDHPLPAFREAQRSLSSGGLFMFSTLGPDTLRELRAAFADGDAHTQRFTDMHDLGDMLLEAGFADPVVDMETITLTYDTLDALFADLRAAGSSCAMLARRQGVLTPRRLNEVRAAYDSLRKDGKLPATFEVVYGHAWKGEAKAVASRGTQGSDKVIRFMPREAR